jgi:maltose phosphorylase
MNIVYGFGGMRSDGAHLIFKPSLPSAWNSYSFKVVYQQSTLSLTVDPELVNIKVIDGSSVDIQVYDNHYTIDKLGVQIHIERVELE